MKVTNELHILAFSKIVENLYLNTLLQNFCFLNLRVFFFKLRILWLPIRNLLHFDHFMRNEKFFYTREVKNIFFYKLNTAKFRQMGKLGKVTREGRKKISLHLKISLKIHWFLWNHSFIYNKYIVIFSRVFSAIFMTL